MEKPRMGITVTCPRAHTLDAANPWLWVRLSDSWPSVSFLIQLARQARFQTPQFSNGSSCLLELTAQGGEDGS